MSGCFRPREGVSCNVRRYEKGYSKKVSVPVRGVSCNPILATLSYWIYMVSVPVRGVSCNDDCHKVRSTVEMFPSP